ncbi:zinc finger protein 250-like [Cephus cinctus]|uniref:Zinc finger protein 250-like n=1 Tax=Cephus cinctus TaxID=211228 RepID=A0AAJ7RAK3_CEPCN|nr:zinc finger protein 250-like [Cephus cinctus]
MDLDFEYIKICPKEEMDEVPAPVSTKRKRRGHVCVCGRSYAYERSLNSHKRYECGKPRNLPCPICDFTHQRTTQQITDCHPMEGIDVNDKQFSCVKCGEFYKWKKSLLQHKRIECGKSPRFACKFCESRNFLCNACGKRYKYREGLARHKRVECGGKEPQYGCPICGKKFKHRYQLRPHLAKVHTIQALPSELHNNYLD